MHFSVDLHFKIKDFEINFHFRKKYQAAKFNGQLFVN
jgi:hypothetical protein